MPRKEHVFGAVGVLLGFVVFATPIFAQTPLFTRDLWFSTRGNDVRALQSRLGVITTGYFGPLTRAAVIRFQKERGITPTFGYVGPKTRKVLNEEARLLVIPQSPTPSLPPVTTTNEPQVCNPNLLTSSGMDSSRIIDQESCDLLNTLYTEKKAAGNIGDTYENRDGLHVNFCEGWTPNPDCPRDNRLFPQHSWKFSGGLGRATAVSPGVTIGQVSYAGQVTPSFKHGIPWLFYQSQSGADALYSQYTSGNLYVYPSLYEDSFVGLDSDPEILKDPKNINAATENTANTPFVIASKQIAKQGVDYYRIHDASGSEFPFIKMALAGLASFKPEVKQTLAQGVSVGNDRLSLLMPTLQALIRYSHKSVTTDANYLASPAHRSTSMAHYFSNGLPQPAYDLKKLITMTNDLTLADVPPLVQIKIISETFEENEKVFSTPGAISRSAKYNTPTRTIALSAVGSVDAFGKSDNIEYEWRVLEGSNLAKVTVNQNNSAEATVEFYPASETQRVDVAVFARKIGGKYYSVPGIISNYIHP